MNMEPTPATIVNQWKSRAEAAEARIAELERQAAAMRNALEWYGELQTNGEAARAALSPAAGRDYVPRVELTAAQAEVSAVLDAMPQDAVVRVRENGGPENVLASLAVSVAKLVHQRDAAKGGKP